MAQINGKSGDDFIHAEGDGLIAPPGYRDIIGVTDTGDTIKGGTGDDIIYAGAGNDIIYGGAGADSLYGGDGFDDFRVTSNADIDGLAETIDGGAGINVLTITGEGGSIDITKMFLINVSDLSAGSFVTPYNIVMTPDQLNGFTHQIAIGEGGSITLSEAGKVILDGTRAGSTAVFGSSGDDRISIKGSLDNAALFGGDGDDRLKLSPTEPTLFTTRTMNGEDGNDSLTGGGYHDVLDGGTGNDSLSGGKWWDTLTGGAGADSFLFTSYKDSQPGTVKNQLSIVRHDTITDFSHTDGDHIDLSRIDADSTLAGNQAFHLGGAAFTNEAGEIIQFDDGHGAILVQADVNGDGVADMEIVLLGGPVLTIGDFLL